MWIKKTGKVLTYLSGCGYAGFLFSSKWPKELSSSALSSEACSFLAGFFGEPSWTRRFEVLAEKFSILWGLRPDFSFAFTTSVNGPMLVLCSKMAPASLSLPPCKVPTGFVADICWVMGSSGLSFSVRISRTSFTSSSCFLLKRDAECSGNCSLLKLTGFSILKTINYLTNSKGIVLFHALYLKTMIFGFHLRNEHLDTGKIKAR